MSGNGLPLIEGIGVSVNGDLQAAIDQAGAAYRRKFERAPSHVALPPGADPAAINLYGVLNVARAAGAGVVIVGRVIGDTNGAGGGPAEAEQMELFDV